MTTPKLIPTAAGVRELARLSRRDTSAAEAQFQAADEETQRAMVLTATGTDRPSILFLASDIAPLVADLPAGILARTLVACDDLEHSLVLANLAPGQLQAQIDLWAWRADGCDLDIERLGDWLENLTTHDEAESLASHLASLDPSFLALWLYHLAPPHIDPEQVIVARSAGEGWHATPGDFTPGSPAGRVLLDRIFTGDPATLDRVLDRLLGLDDATAQSDELPSGDPTWRLITAEEPLDEQQPPGHLVIAARVRWHQRLQALGFTAESDLNRLVPIPPADPGPASGMLPTRSGMPLMARAMEHLAEQASDAMPGVIADLVEIHNHVLLNDPDALTNQDDPHDGLHPIDGLINLGLEHTATALGEAAQALSQPGGPQTLYRLGASIAARIAERASALTDQSGVPLRMLDCEPELNFPAAISIPLARLTAEPPRLLVDDEERSLQHRADLFDLEHVHDDIAGYLRLFQAGLPMTIGDGLALPRRAPMVLGTTDLILAWQAECAVLDCDPQDGLLGPDQRATACKMLSTPDGVAEAQRLLTACLQVNGWSAVAAERLLTQHLQRALRSSRQDARHFAAATRPEQALPRLSGLTA